jgi:hypothetical protein
MQLRILPSRPRPDLFGPRILVSDLFPNSVETEPTSILLRIYLLLFRLSDTLRQ